MSRRRAHTPEIPQCLAYFDLPEGQLGPFDCFRYPCCLEKGHDEGHENDLIPKWPTALDVAEGYKVFDPTQHEHFCSDCSNTYLCNEMICERPLLCDRCKKWRKDGPKELAPSV